MKQVKRCYIYIRVSTAMQVEGYSLEAQREKLRNYAGYQDMEIVREYCDAGRSGKSITGRPEFTQMLEDIGNGRDEVDFILVFKLSRFGRNAADVLNSLQYIQDYGVNLICVEDGIDSSKDSGKLTITVLSAVAEIERENILVQTMEGRRQKAREGRWSAGYTPFGYSLEPNTGKLLIVEDEAKIVRLVFEMYTKMDKSLEEIAEYLNSHGYEKKKNRENEINYFQRRFILLMIDNPVYVGKIVCGRRTSERVKGTRDQYRTVWTDDYVEADGLHEAIIDEVTWNMAQLKRERTRMRWVKTHSLEHEHILSGIIKCPICGKGMSGTVSRHTKKDSDKYKDTFYYRCLHSGRMEDGRKCDFKGNLNQDKFNAEIEEVIRKLVQHEEMRDHIMSKLTEMTDVSTLLEEREQSKLLLEQVRGAKDRLLEQMDTLEKSDRHYWRKMDDMQERLDGLYDRMAEIESVISDFDVRIDGVYENKFSSEQVYKVLVNFDKFYDKMTDMEKKEFMRLFVERIEIRAEAKRGEPRFRKMKLRFPVYLDGTLGDEVCLRDGVGSRRYVYCPNSIQTNISRLNLRWMSLI